MSKQRVNDSTCKRNPYVTLRVPAKRALASVALSFALGAFPLFSGAAAAEDSAAANAAEAAADQGSPQADAGTDASSTAQAYAFSGAYRGAFVADANTADMEGEAVAASEPGQNAMLAQHGGWATARDCSLAKTGEGASGDESDLYGTNSVALAANAGSATILENTSAQSDSQGANALFATDSATVWANATSATATADDSRGLVSTFAGTIVANNLDLQTTGNRSAAIDVGCGGGAISVTNSMMSVASNDSPILHSAGTVEAENIMARTSSAQLATLEGTNAILLSRATLSSSTAQGNSGTGDDGIVIYRPDSQDVAAADTEDIALFQAADSTLSSSVKDGALLYLTNTQAKVVLSDTNLEFDSSSAKLMQVTGNNAQNWGKAGENGATATFTGLDQKLNGDIEVDSISTLDCYLLESTDWTGSSAISVRSGDTARAENLTVNIDATSSWTVTANSTVTNLNLATGGKLVDEKGESVKIVDADGLTLVDGASDISITVTGDFSTSVKTSSANELEGPTIDRSEFDGYFDLETTFGTNGADGNAGSEEQALEAVSYIRNWFYNL